MAKNEMAVVNSFQLVTGFEDMDEELMQELEDEMEDLDDEKGIFCRKIKIPSGGGKAFEVESDDPDDPEIMKEITGVVVFTHRMNSYWEEDFGSGDSTNQPPACSSMDAKQGLYYETGELRTCDTCPNNQFAADGSGKACKNLRRVYLMMSGRPDLYLLTVPPTSLRDVNKQLAKIMGVQKIPYTGMLVTFRLDKAKNKGGIEYSKITIEKSGMLAPEHRKATAEIRKQLKEKYKEVAVAPEDLNVIQGPAVDENGFMNVATDGELPFA